MACMALGSVRKRFSLSRKTPGSPRNQLERKTTWKRSTQNRTITDPPKSPGQFTRLAPEARNLHLLAFHWYVHHAAATFYASWIFGFCRPVVAGGEYLLIIGASPFSFLCDHASSCICLCDAIDGVRSREVGAGDAVGLGCIQISSKILDESR